MAPLLHVTLVSAGLIAMCSATLRADPAVASGKTHILAKARADTAPDAGLAPKRHPLKGVIVDVRADKHALLVKHEEIPGVMRAMTMLLKTDADTLKRATKGQAITGLLVRKADGWWIEAVKPAN